MALSPWPVPYTHLDACFQVHPSLDDLAVGLSHRRGSRRSPSEIRSVRPCSYSNSRFGCDGTDNIQLQTKSKRETS